MSNVPPELTSLLGFILFLGTPAFLSFVVSDFLEFQLWFQNLESRTKNYLLIVLSILLAVLSKALATYIPVNVLTTLDPWYQVIVTAIFGYVTSQLWHDSRHAGNSGQG